MKPKPKSSPPKPQRYATSQAEAAAALGVTRRTFSRWKSLPGWPSPKSDGRIDLDACRAFVTMHGLKGGETSEIQKLRARRLVAQCEKLEIENRTRRGELVLLTDLVKEIGPLLSGFRATVYQKIEEELPMSVCGLSVPEGRIVARRFCDEVLTRLQLAFQKWEC